MIATGSVWGPNSAPSGSLLHENVVTMRPHPGPVNALNCGH